ncbi:MAG: phenylacetate-CoA oxygenase subunit PaaC [Beijerinckiaceae bacterium]|nr:phenylacetate-CoA oxygenase subunit PaaC [Beijerinckiaceae bacterium]
MTARSLIIEETPLVLYCLRRADDALILGHRLSEWCGHGPTLEEDMALSNMGLDLLGQARSLYSYAADVEGRGATEDGYAYLREERQYRNLLLAEQPNGDFAQTIARQFFYAAFADLFWRAMTSSADDTLAAIACKSEKEMAYHLRHSAEWVIRLGDGTGESHARMQAAVAAMWSFTGEMFAMDDAERELIEQGKAIDLGPLRDGWRATVSDVLRTATLDMPASSWMQQGGRAGRHGEYLGHILAELQHLQRSYPGAAW